jgi:hypothetical protein
MMMFFLFRSTTRNRPAAFLARKVAALLSCTLIAATVAVPVSAIAAEPAAESPVPFELPAKPSEMLRAPLDRWKAVLTQADKALERAMADVDKPAAGAGLHIQRTVLSQAQEAWPEVLEAVHKARQQQSSEAGRQTAGLLNEVLARQALKGGDAAWLKQELRDQVLSMPWTDVEPAIRGLRQQLVMMTAEGVQQFVVDKMDTATALVQNRVSLGFIMQLLALRFQLLEVLPRRDVLVAALDEAIAQRSVAVAR